MSGHRRGDAGRPPCRRGAPGTPREPSGRPSRRSGHAFSAPARPFLAALLIAVFLAAAEGASAAPPGGPAPAAPVVPPSGPGFTTLAAFTLPPEFYVGDRVELRIRLSVKPGTVLRAPAKMPTDRWATIDSISITKTSDYSVVHLFFVSFAPGERSLPPIDLGGVTMRGIKVTTASLVAQGRTRLSDPKGQLALPGTTLMLGLAIALLIGLPLGGVALFRRLRVAAAAFVENRSARRPWRQLSRALDALAAGRPPVNPKRFYITLVDELKRYLSVKYGRDFRSVTAREFTTAAGAVPVAGEAAEELQAVVSFGELVKFAGAEAGQESRLRDLDRVRAIVERIEEESTAERRERQAQHKGRHPDALRTSRPGQGERP